MWNMYTTTIEKPQFQGINQGFRVIGGKTKIEGLRVRAFQIETTPYNLEQLGEYVPEEFRVDESQLFKMSRMSIEEARKKYPEWYERRVIRKEKKGTWTCKVDLYHWWIEQIKSSASVGHRYFCIMCLAIYAVKCGVDFENLKKDAYSLIPFLNELSADDEFTSTDVDSALECFDANYATFPRKDIERLTAIALPINKRNHRPQEKHLEYARGVRQLRNSLGEIVSGGGRPDKSLIVKQWQSEHPKGKKVDCIRETGLSKPTVYKYWEI